MALSVWPSRMRKAAAIGIQAQDEPLHRLQTHQEHQGMHGWGAAFDNRAKETPVAHELLAF